MNDIFKNRVTRITTNARKKERKKERNMVSCERESIKGVKNLFQHQSRT